MRTVLAGKRTSAATFASLAESVREPARSSGGEDAGARSRSTASSATRDFSLGDACGDVLVQLSEPLLTSEGGQRAAGATNGSTAPPAPKTAFACLKLAQEKLEEQQTGKSRLTGSFAAALQQNADVPRKAAHKGDSKAKLSRRTLEPML
jgi:hypothetical protein